MEYTSKPALRDYMSMVKFAHTIFAMPFALTGFFLGFVNSNKPFSWNLLILVVLCMVFARNAAMAFNRYIDREIDSKNPRTALREIPAGIVKPKSVLNFAMLNILFFITCTWFINPVTFYLSPVALVIVLGYSLTKKFTNLCHFILGIGLALAPIGAYLAVTGTFGWLPILYSLLVVFWVSGFDMLYALQDEDFDKKMNLRSLVVSLGKQGVLKLSAAVHAVSAGFIIIIGMAAGFGTYYWIGSIIFAGLLSYQHMIVKPGDLSRLNLAFFTLNGLASLIFAVFNITEILIR